MGAEAEAPAVGTAVYGMLDGWEGKTCAEYLTVKAHQLAVRPASLSFEEAAALPRMREVHADPGDCRGLDCVPKGLNRPVTDKSPAQWAYERLILYIRNFEKQLDGEHEVALGLTGGNAGNFPIPISIIPGNLSWEEITSLA